MRIRAADGTLAGTAVLYKPAVGMATLATMAVQGDLEHFARMQGVARPARRPAAILFADLESSSSLSRRLSTAGYFAVGRRLVRAADQCIVDSGGLVGRHVGDGIAAFFLAENAGSESAAARACITAGRELRRAMADVATRSSLENHDGARISASGQKACNKPCNKVGKFSLMQSQAKSRKSCKTVRS